MILTKDNLLRFVRENKCATPTQVAESFDTTTMIGSAALSELAKEQLLKISHLKLGSTPYYYDPKQKECLIALGEKQYSGYEKEVFHLLKQNEILNDNSLSIQLKLAIERIKDFAIPLEINFQGKALKFWVWYMRDINETREQILEILNPKEQKSNSAKKEEKNITQSNSQEQVHKSTITENEKPVAQQQSQLKEVVKEEKEDKPPVHNFKDEIEEEKQERKSPFHNYESENNSSQMNITKPELSKTENFIESYFSRNYLAIENKNKTEKGIQYTTSLTINKIKILFDCFYYYKKPTDAEVIQFYTSSLKPKIVFIENAPKKLYTLAETLENFTLVNI